MDRMSFKGTVDASRQYSIAIAQARSKKKQRELIGELLRVIACDQMPDRPGRREPRAVKRKRPVRCMGPPAAVAGFQRAGRIEDISDCFMPGQRWSTSRPSSQGSIPRRRQLSITE